MHELILDVHNNLFAFVDVNSCLNVYPIRVTRFKIKNEK